MDLPETFGRNPKVIAILKKKYDASSSKVFLKPINS